MTVDEGRVRRRTRRDEILEIAVGLFASRGYHGVSMDDIGAAAGADPAGGAGTRPCRVRPDELDPVPRRGGGPGAPGRAAPGGHPRRANLNTRQGGCPTMIGSLLVANRGEIARRVIRTARR